MPIKSMIAFSQTHKSSETTRKNLCDELATRLENQMILESKTQELMEYLEKAIYGDVAQQSIHQLLRSFKYCREDCSWDSTLGRIVATKHAFPSDYNRIIIHLQWARGITGPTEISISYSRSHGDTLFQVSGGRMHMYHFVNLETMVWAIEQYLLTAPVLR